MIVCSLVRRVRYPRTSCLTGEGNEISTGCFASQRSGKFRPNYSKEGAPLFSCASRKSLGVEVEVILRLPRIYFEQLLEILRDQGLNTTGRPHKTPHDFDLILRTITS